MAQELTFNISEDRRKLQGPVEAKNFNLKFGTDDVAITNGNPKQWVQGRIGDNELKQVFVNITEGENNTPKDVAGLFLAFVGIIHDKDGRPHRVVDYKHSTTIDVEHGRFRFDFPDQAFTVAGEYQQAFFMLVKEGPGGGCVATMEFDMQVMANFVFTDLVPEDYITPFNDTVDQLLAACKKFKDDTAADEAKFKQELQDAYDKFQKDTNTQLNNFKDATDEDLANFKKANADDIAKFKQQYADAVQAKEDELQSKVDSYTDKIDTMLKDLNQQGVDTTTMLTNLRSQMAALQDKINSEHLFTEDEAKQLENRLALKLNTGFEHIYGTVDEMLSDQALGAGMYVKTAGYYTVNDGGGAGYVITSKEPANYSEKLNNGLFAELLYGSEPVNVLNFGVKNDGTQDCSKLVNEQTKIHALYFPAGKYLANEQLDIYHNLYGEVGPAGMSKDEKGLTTIKSGITGDNTKSLICNHGDSTIISKLNLHLNDNENGITDNGKYVTRINDIYIDHVKNACGIKIDRPGSRASVINNVFVNGDAGNYASTGLYYLTGTDELLSNFWSMGCRVGIFAVVCLFYATNIHIWCGTNIMDFYQAARGVELHRSKAFFTNFYADTVRFALAGDGSSYTNISNFIYSSDDSFDNLLPNLAWDGYFDVKKSDYVAVNGGFVYNRKFPASHALLDPAHVRLDNLLITVPDEAKPENYLSDFYRNMMPNMVMGYGLTYRLDTQDMDGKYVEIARIPIEENMFGHVVLQISDSHVNNSQLTVELNDGTASLVDTGGNHYEDIAYKIINNWFVVFAKQNGEYDSNLITATQLGGLGPVNYDYLRVTGEKPFPRLEQDNDNGLTHLHADSSASNA